MIWLIRVFFGLAVFFGIMGNIGVIVFPDVFTRLHASSKCSTTSVLSLLIGSMLITGFSSMTGRIAVIMLFFLITSPVASHIVGRSAWRRGILPWKHIKGSEK